MNILPGDEFTIVNGYGMYGYDRTTDGLGYTEGGLTGDGDLFYIGVTNDRTGEQFASFCAHGGSATFSAEGYLIAESMNDARYLSAFNFIMDNYNEATGFGDMTFVGKPTSARRIAQVVVWALLGNIDVESGAFENTKLTELEKEAVIATLAAVGDGYAGASVIDVLHMQCKVHGVGEHGLANCQPQIVPVFGTFYVVNEVEDIDVYNKPSFNKTKFGVIRATIGEFAFDLYKKVGEDWKPVDESDFIIPAGEAFTGNRFYTNLIGVVTTDYYLKPGSYMFREVLKTYQVPNADYRMIWKADDLFFEINAMGEVVWSVSAGDLDENGSPTLDNTFWNKSIMQWVGEIITGAGTMGEELDDGYIFYPGGAGGDAVVFEITYPNCTQGGVIWFFYSNEDGSKGQPLMDLAFAQPLDHAWELNTMGDGLRCSVCGLDIGWWDLSPELYAIYQDLGGLGAW